MGHDVGTGAIYEDENIKVIAVQNSHFDFPTGDASGKHKSYAFRFEAPDRVIVFTGNTGPSDAVTEVAKGADLLVTKTSSCEERKQAMIKDGRWQAMPRWHHATGNTGPHDLGRYYHNAYTRQCQNGGAVSPNEVVEKNH